MPHDSDEKHETNLDDAREKIKGMFVFICPLSCRYLVIQPQLPVATRPCFERMNMLPECESHG